MDPLLLRVNQPDTLSFSVNQFNYLHSFPGLWHYHPEFELTLILKGAGTRFVGDHVESFEAGDLVLIGKNLAHTWRSDTAPDGLPGGPAEALVTHFREEFLGSAFFDIPEMLAVRGLLNRSARGLKVTGAVRARLTAELKLLQDFSGAAKLLKLLHLLVLLSESDELTTLASEGFCQGTSDSDSDRINKVYAYIMNNFQQQIRLADVAEMAHMSPTAFSRYFTQRTRKPFSQFLIEKKVGYACRLLMSARFSILQICYECGFQNVSSFNKQFKKITGVTPRQYQLTYKPFGGQPLDRSREDDRVQVCSEG
ncbi:AraC family transcriptional regulator [Ravibacter arvi]|uniref:AraC family transcriptional regulator n=1 Tax=Ravibacter arvi TaxID=2051041 RepID=A0ABP8LYT1_9BACT